MKITFKLIVSILLVLTLLLGVMPLSVFAMLSPTVHPDSVWVGGVEMKKNTYLANGGRLCPLRQRRRADAEQLYLCGRGQNL